MGNNTAKLCKATAVCLWAAGATVALYLGFTKEAFDIGTAALTAAACFLLGLFTWAAGEAVGILHDIRANGWQADPAKKDPSKPGLYVEDIAAFKPAEPEPDPELAQLESFIWVCDACGEINLSSSDSCRICKADKTKK